MAEKEKMPAPEEIVVPCSRAFFVYYVAIVIFLLGPRLNPDVWIFGVFHFSMAVGTLLGLALVALVVYLKLGREYRLSPRVGNLVIEDKSGGPEMFWFGLANPKEVREEIERRRPRR